MLSSIDGELIACYYCLFFIVIVFFLFYFLSLSLFYYYFDRRFRFTQVSKTLVSDFSVE